MGGASADLFNELRDEINGDELLDEIRAELSSVRPSSLRSVQAAWKVACSVLEASSVGGTWVRRTSAFRAVSAPHCAFGGVCALPS